MPAADAQKQTLVTRPTAEPDLSAGVAAAEIKEYALDAGFDLARIAEPDELGEAGKRFKDYLEHGYHGDMAWLERRIDWRRAPQKLWPEVRSIIVLGLNYGPEHDPLAALQCNQNGAISVYALGTDYHDVVKKKLKQVAGWIHRRFGAEVKVFVDTAPVLEKPLAQRAGLGWQGKHTNLVARDYGSWLFLGTIYTTLELAPDPPERDHCGHCQACLDICPTSAFQAPYQLDARRCISYLTIEHKGHIEASLRPLIGNRIYGCDDCLAVCPWNKFAQLGQEHRLRDRGDLRSRTLAELARLDDAGFRRLFARTPIKRLGRDRLVRNVLIAIGNSGQTGLICEVEERLPDPSPLVRAMAVWALWRLSPSGQYDMYKARFLDGENDPAVRAEWLRSKVLSAS